MFNKKVKRQSFTRRAFILGGVKAGIFAVLMARLYYLQIIKEDEYKTFADSNRIRLSLIPPLRGKILDRGGRNLAVNRIYYRIIFDPLIKDDVKTTITKLAGFLSLSPEETDLMLRKVKSYSSHRPLVLYEHLTWQQIAKIEVNSINLASISIDSGQMRYCPMGVESPHIIGYLGSVPDREIKDNPLLNHPDFKIGMSGVEQSFDDSLRGKPGIKKVEVNAFGRAVRELNRDEGQPGKDLSLTIDLRLQKYISTRLSGLSAGTVVIDVLNGDILSICSTPGFDPNQFTYGLSQKEWNALITHPQHPLVNKTIANQYPPGSTFKTIVALAALMQSIDPEEHIYCPGYVVLGNRRFHCWKKEGHGSLNMANAIKHSCNCYFYTMGKKIGIENIAATARLFGLGEVHDISIAEQQAGRVPDPKWKLARFKQGWQVGDTLNASIGQGYILATPLQLAVMTSRLASGKQIKPRLTISGKIPENINFEPINIPVRYFDIVKDGMNRVVNEIGGTAYGSRIIGSDNYSMAGKTGTSQVVSRRISTEEFALMTEWQRRQFQNHALFVGFAPFYQSRYAISVVIEHGGSGSQAAAPIARDILDYVHKLNIT